MSRQWGSGAACTGPLWMRGSNMCHRTIPFQLRRKPQPKTEVKQFSVRNYETWMDIKILFIELIPQYYNSGYLQGIIIPVISKALYSRQPLRRGQHWRKKRRNNNIQNYGCKYAKILLPIINTYAWFWHQCQNSIKILLYHIIENADSNYS